MGVSHYSYKAFICFEFLMFSRSLYSVTEKWKNKIIDLYIDFYNKNHVKLNNSSMFVELTVLVLEVNV